MQGSSDPDRCLRCRYFEDTGHGGGECRRHAPRPGVDADEAVWPAVMQSDWCGEFAPLPEPL